MAGHFGPPTYLTRIVTVSAAQVVPTIPLEPPARVVFVYPAFLYPNLSRLTRSNTEKIALCVIVTTLAQLRILEPTLGKLLMLAVEIIAAKDPELEHLLRRKIGLECRVIKRSQLLGAFIGISSLKSILSNDFHSYSIIYTT